MFTVTAERQTCAFSNLLFLGYMIYTDTMKQEEYQILYKHIFTLGQSQVSFLTLQTCGSIFSVCKINQQLSISPEMLSQSKRKFVQFYHI